MKLGPLTITWGDKPAPRATPDPVEPKAHPFASTVDPITRMKRLARAADDPSRNGRIPDGPSAFVFGNHAVLLADERGRMFEIHGAEIRNGRFTRICNPRAAMVELFERFGMEDFDPDAMEPDDG